MLPHALASPLEGDGNALGSDRLQEVVDGVDLKGLDRVLVEGGHEDHGLVSPQELENLEAADLRHLDVQEEEVGPQLVDRLDRLEAVAALRHDLHLLLATEVLPQDRPGRLLVVHDDHAERTRRAGSRRGDGRGGRRLRFGHPGLREPAPGLAQVVEQGAG